MENIPVTDQWKLNGNCRACRRRSYCRKACSAHSRRTERIVTGAMFSAMGEAMSSGGYRKGAVRRHLDTMERLEEKRDGIDT